MKKIGAFEIFDLARNLVKRERLKKRLEMRRKRLPGYRINPVTGKQYSLKLKRDNIAEVYEGKSKLYKIAKRGFDILLSSSLLLILSPVFLGTAILIHHDDGFPIFYSGDRTGKHLKPFTMHKFRSMYNNSYEKREQLEDQNEKDGAIFKIKDDPRITKVGKFLRKLSIDELPQLYNILKGDMSFVGPRPMQVYELPMLGEYQRQRYTVTPGLTGYWQVSGRSNLDWREWVELDLDYIEDVRHEVLSV